MTGIKELSARLGVNRDEMRDLASRAGVFYRPFSASRPSKPFSHDGPRRQREIDNPQGRLKEIQERIYRRLLKEIPLPPDVLGGVAGRSTLDNARIHLGGSVVVAVDIKSFFPSVTNAMVFSAWRRLGFGTDAASLLAQLTTHEGHLPQGAPTSTALANLVLVERCHGRLAVLSTAAGVVVSYWVDDITLSGEAPELLIAGVISILQAGGFRVNRRKLKIMRRSQRQEVNGILLGERLSVRRSQVADLRSGIHKLKRGVVLPGGRKRYIAGLEGRLGYLRRIDGSKAAPLGGEFKSVVGRS